MNAITYPSLISVKKIGVPATSAPIKYFTFDLPDLIVKVSPNHFTSLIFTVHIHLPDSVLSSHPLLVNVSIITTGSFVLIWSIHQFIYLFTGLSVRLLSWNHELKFIFLGFGDTNCRVLWHVIRYPCLRYLLMGHSSSKFVSIMCFKSWCFFLQIVDSCLCRPARNRYQLQPHGCTVSVNNLFSEKAFKYSLVKTGCFTLCSGKILGSVFLTLSAKYMHFLVFSYNEPKSQLGWFVDWLNIFILSFMTSIGLIKSNRPLFQLHYSVTYVFGKYLIFGKTLDKMLHFQYILKLITCHASFRSCDTKQWHTLWSRKTSFKCVTGNISSAHHSLYNLGMKCDRQA